MILAELQPPSVVWLRKVWLNVDKMYMFIFVL